MSLFWRIFSLNAAGLVVATALLLGPVTVSTPVLRHEALILLGGLVVLLAGNAAVLRIGLTPLQRLGRAMTTADLLVPGARPTVAGPAEAAELIATYNTMLDRLQAERAAGAGRALHAQERERHRIARELHDEVGQTLTAVLLQLKRVADRVPGELREEVSLAQEATRAGLDEIRRIARRLRPESGESPHTPCLRSRDSRPRADRPLPRPRRPAPAPPGSGTRDLPGRPGGPDQHRPPRRRRPRGTPPPSAARRHRTARPRQRHRSR
ncbi:sensor histidine kinase [Streptomyces sp. DHE17-7]|uniref:sensor histidine kinase n=1 Tax=Streptomyces sp. DHE17-7 TaxID=2759949 RepID=UPI003FA7753F